MTCIGPTSFSAIGGDGAANVELAKRLIVEKWGWIIKLTDPCHHMSNTGKDIGKMEYFAEVGPMANKYSAYKAVIPCPRIHSGYIASPEAHKVFYEVYQSK